MGKKKRESPPYASAEEALAECKRRLGDARCAAVLRGLRRKVHRPTRLRATVALWESLKALGPELRALKNTVKASRAIESEGTGPYPASLREQLEDSWEELENAPVGPAAVRALLERLEPWLREGDGLLKEANRIRPRGEVTGSNAKETTAIARYLVTVSSKEGWSITKTIAALLEVAHGSQLPHAPDARDSAWEQRLEKWKKALERAKASASSGRTTRGR